MSGSIDLETARSLLCEHLWKYLADLPSARREAVVEVLSGEGKWLRQPVSALDGSRALLPFYLTYDLSHQLLPLARLQEHRNRKSDLVRARKTLPAVLAARSLRATHTLDAQHIDSTFQRLTELAGEEREYCLRAQAGRHRRDLGHCSALSRTSQGLPGSG